MEENPPEAPQIYVFHVERQAVKGLTYKGSRMFVGMRIRLLLSDNYRPQIPAIKSTKNLFKSE